MKKKEPKITGRCATCGKEVAIKPRSGVNPALYVDAFCSTVCAKAYFGVQMPSTGTAGT